MRFSAMTLFAHAPGFQPFLLALTIGVWIGLIILGLKAARAKGRSPHWMWFGLHPLGALIAFLVLRFGVRPLTEVRANADLLRGLVLCTACFRPFAGAPARRFLGLGFREITCPHCRTRVSYPLTTGLLVTYWIIATVGIVGPALAFLLEGRMILLPGLLVILAGAALIHDTRLRTRLRAAEKQFRASRVGSTQRLEDAADPPADSIIAAAEEHGTAALQRRSLAGIAVVAAIAVGVVAIGYVGVSRALSSAGRAPTVAAESPTSRLMLGSQTVELSSAIGPTREYNDALRRPERFPASEQLSISGVILSNDGKPVGGLSVFLAPVDDEGPHLILGTDGGLLGVGNPKATTDEKGQLAMKAGPLWRFTSGIGLGLLVQRTPDHPFDLMFLPIMSGGELLVSKPTEQKREIDLGVITLAANVPSAVNGGG